MSFRPSGSQSPSINQSSKEALYTVTSRAEKYPAKAFIGLFEQRLAKAIAVGVSLAVTVAFSDFSTIRWLGLVTAAVVVPWMLAARYAGRRASTSSRTHDPGRSDVDRARRELH